MAAAPFGQTYGASPSGAAQNLSFTGMNSGTVSGLYDFLYREYNPNEGRWASPDKAGVSAAHPPDPQSWNRYTYVRNSPLELIDNLGLGCGPPDWQIYYYEETGQAPCLYSPPGDDATDPSNLCGIVISCDIPVPAFPSNCAAALNHAGVSRAARLRGAQNWDTLASRASEFGVDPGILAAIGTYQTQFRDTIGSGAVGIFAADQRYFPNAPYTGNFATDIGPQAALAAAKLGLDEYNLGQAGFSHVQAELGAIRDYNASPALTETLLSAGYPEYLDVHTTARNHSVGGAYVYNVVQIAVNCFGAQ